jgi:hypothetical protein
VAENFLITGLPRSRTGWLSVVASGQKSICHHEPTPHLATYDALGTVYADDRFHYVGVSDSALVQQIGRIMHDHNAKALIVRRDPEEAARAFEKYFGEDLGKFDPVLYCRTMDQHLDRYLGCDTVRFIGYDQLSDVNRLEAALTWLMPEARFPKLRELMHMNVQVDRAYAARLARIPHSFWHMDRSWESAHSEAA